MHWAFPIGALAFLVIGPAGTGVDCEVAVACLHPQHSRQPALTEFSFENSRYQTRERDKYPSEQDLRRQRANCTRLGKEPRDFH
jgi:hypothetical protein